MSRDTRRLKLEADLEVFEASYAAQLRIALGECIQGYWGLFSESKYLSQPVELLELGAKIDAIRADLGLEPHPWHARLLEHRASHREHAPGDPKRAAQFLAALDEGLPVADKSAVVVATPATPAGRIMYIEDKLNGVVGQAHIGRVTASKRGATLRYGGREFIRIKGFKSNYLSNDGEYWISGPRRDGQDGLYGHRPTPIDEDCREEYWLSIRRAPHRVAEKTS